MSTLILGILSFFVQAFALKLAVGAMGAPRAKNTYSTAMTVAFGLNLAGFLLGFIPFVGWLVYLVLWFAVIMSVYDLGFWRSIGVAVLQVVLKLAIGLLLKILGLGASSVDSLTGF